MAGLMSVEFFAKLANGEAIKFTSPPGINEIVIGRKNKNSFEGNRLNIHDKYMSRKHCRVYWNEHSGWTVADLKSAAGTRMAGLPIDSPIAVQSGVVIQAGTTVIRVVPCSQDSAPVSTKGAHHYDENEATEIPGVVAAPDVVAADGDATVMLGRANQERAPIARSAPVSSGADVTSIVTQTDVDMGETIVAHSVAADPDATVAETVAEAPPGPAAEPTITETDSEPRPGGRRSPGRSSLPGAADTVLPGMGLGKPANEEVPLSMIERFGDGEQALPGTDTLWDLPGLPGDLVNRGLLDGGTALECLEAARDSGASFFRILAERRSAAFIDGIYEWISSEYGFRLMRDENELFEEANQPEWLSLDQAKKLGILGLSGGRDGHFNFALIDPFDVITRDWISASKRAGLEHEICLATAPAFQGALERVANLNPNSEDEIGLDINLSEAEEQVLKDQMGDIDVPQIVNFFLHRASMEGASDIHVEPTENSLLVRLRVNGILFEERSLPASYRPEITSRLKIMSGMNVAEKRRPQDGRIGIMIRGKPIDVRVSTYPTVHGEKVVMRLLDKSALRPSPELLGLLDRDLRLLKDKLLSPFGLIMISGPTGSGKTTTLYSCLGSIDKTSKNVLTVEDPVEYQMAGVHQMQVNDKIGLTFASGLRTILRQDPDVIMVGECRDGETAAMAIQASLTGHVVFSTIHTNDAIGVVTRLIDMGIEPFLVASALSLTIAQRLVREICPHCRTAVSGAEILRVLQREGISPERLHELGIEIDTELDYAEGAGCKHCRQTGYGARRAVFEVFEIGENIRTLVADEHYSDSKLRRLAYNSGMTTLIEHGLKLVDDEITTFSEVIRVLGEST